MLTGVFNFLWVKKWNDSDNPPRTLTEMTKKAIWKTNLACSINLCINMN